MKKKVISQNLTRLILYCILLYWMTRYVLPTGLFRCIAKKKYSCLDKHIFRLNREYVANLIIYAGNVPSCIVTLF